MRPTALRGQRSAGEQTGCSAADRMVWRSRHTRALSTVLNSMGEMCLCHGRISDQTIKTAQITLYLKRQSAHVSSELSSLVNGNIDSTIYFIPYIHHCFVIRSFLILAPRICARALTVRGRLPFDAELWSVATSSQSRCRRRRRCYIAPRPETLRWSPCRALLPGFMFSSPGNANR